MAAHLAYIALGGAFGSVLRALVGGFVVFPFGTLTVNILGSFAIGVAYAMGLASRDIGPFLMIGVVGGFTTFSTFSLDTLKLMEAGQTPMALTYIIASFALALVAVWGGVALGRLL